MNLKVSFKATDTTQDLVTNFEELKKEVANEVEKYSVEVTEENIPEAKKVMANMNKVKAEIANKYKHHIDTLSLPIQQLKSEKKELENIITKGRQDIADKVSIFEQKKLDIAGEVIFKYLTDVCLEKSIDWKVVQVNDLIKLTAITSKGSLAKATKEAIENRVALIENEILKAKLEAEEKAKRDKEIADKAKEEAEEKARQRELDIRRQAEIDKQKAVDEAKEETKKEMIQEKLPENVIVVEKVAPKATDDGKIIYTVMATFEVKAPINTSHEKIINALKNKLVNAGITTCKHIEAM